MKNAVLSLAFVFIAGLGFSQLNIESGAKVEFEKEVHDYGTLVQGEPAVYEFKFTNTGDKPLIISNCKGSCGCTVPQCEKAPIAPGQTSAVKVKYDTKRTGPINKSVTITSNAVNDPTKTVRIKGTVLAASNGAPVLKDSGAPVNK